MTTHHHRDTTLVFVRHGQTVWNAQQRWQGWLDSPLSETGIRQAEATAEALRSMHFDRVVCSDTGRAEQTARIIAAPHGLEPEPAEGLREKYYGKWEGLTAAEIDARHPGTRFKADRDTRATHRPPDGETMVEVRERVKRFLLDLVARSRGKSLLVVTHSGVVRAVDSLCSGMPFDDIWHRTPPNAGYCIVRVDEKNRFRMVQDFVPDPPKNH